MSTPEDLSNLDPAFDGVLRPVAAGATSCEYFQDRNKRWPFHCDDEGYRLLARLLRAATPVVGAVQAKIDAACDVEGRPDGRAAADAVVAEGQRIYARKPNMGEHDVTWSQLEYGHLGLQKEYIRYKSVQRLTEAWACLQRAKRAGLFFELDETPLMENESPSVPLRWASLGGGPGFELLAVKWFFEKHFPRYALDLVSLDLEASWREAAEGLGLRFSTWDVRDGDGLERAAGGPVDYAVASYVLKMYMANEPCARWLGEKLNRSPGTGGGLRAALVVSRDENLEAASRLMRDASIGNATVVPLMDPEGGRDDRQLAFAPGCWTPPTAPAAEAAPLTFPNVPYEEHKRRRGGGHGGGHGNHQGGRHHQGGGGGFREGGFRRGNGGGWLDHRRDRGDRGDRPRDTGRW